MRPHRLRAVSVNSIAHLIKHGKTDNGHFLRGVCSVRHRAYTGDSEVSGMEERKGRGGARPGAGRPKGTTKPVTRKQRQLRAFDDEWEMIHEFSKIVKRNRARAERMMKTE